MEGLTLEQLQAAGAKPVKKKTVGLSLEELKAAGAKPGVLEQAPARDRSASNAFGIGDDIADVGIGFGKGAATTLMTPAKKLGEIKETVGAKSIAKTSAQSIKELQEQDNKMTEQYVRLPDGDPQKEKLRTALKDTRAEIARIGAALPVAEASVGAQTRRAFSKLDPTTTAQKVGFGIERIAEFIAPTKAVVGTQRAILEGGEGLTAARKAGELNTFGKAAEAVSRPFTALRQAGKAGELNAAGKAVNAIGRTAVRSATEAAQGAVVTAAQGGSPQDIKTASIVGAAFPVVGAVLSGVAKPLRAAMKGTGQKIQEVVIKPSAKDLRDGFQIANVAKHNLGGSLQETVTKSHTTLNKLGRELKQVLEESGEQGARVDLRDVVAATEKRLKGSRAQNFGNNLSIKRVFENMMKDLEETTQGKAVVDLLEATNIKRGAGTKGAWTFGNADPDATAIEKVYTTLYQELRKAIEKNSPASVREINKKISEIIPISNAALRRLPVAQRNNVLGLMDTIGLYSAVFDPSALAIIGANKLSRSGKFAQFLIKAAEKERRSKTPIGKLMFGR